VVRLVPAAPEELQGSGERLPHVDRTDLLLGRSRDSSKASDQVVNAVDFSHDDLRGSHLESLYPQIVLEEVQRRF
jgi:hypothetical protein